MKARVVRANAISNKDILSISSSETMPTEPVTMEQEAPVVINDTSSSQQGQTTVSLLAATVSNLSDEERMICDCQGDGYNTKQTTDNQQWDNNETVSGASHNVVVLKKTKDYETGKGKNKKRNKNELPMEVTNEAVDRTSEFVAECHSNGDVHTAVMNSSANTEPVDQLTKDSTLNDQQLLLHEEPVNGMATEKQYDETISLPTSHSTATNVTTCEGSAEGQENVAPVHLSSDCTVMDSAVPVENTASDETESDANPAKQQTCEESVAACEGSMRAEMHNQTANCNDAPQLPYLHQESPSSSLQGLALVTESLDLQNVNNEAETRPQMDIQGMDSDVAVMKLEGQKKQKSARNKKGVSKKKKRRGRPRKRTRMVDKVGTVPDSTGIQNGCPNTESRPVPVNNNETQSSPEPSVSSTSNGAGNVCMEPSSNYREATMHNDEEFVTAKKLKLENNSITAPSNLVTSTSSDNVGSVRCDDINGCTGNINMSRPFLITESDTVASLADGGNSLKSDAMAATGKSTCRAQGINRRKLLRPKKRKNVKVMTTTTVKAEVHDGVLNSIEVDNHIDHSITNTSLPVGTTDAIQETVQNKYILESHGQQKSVRENKDVTEKERPFRASTIFKSIKPEPEAFTLTAAIPVTNNRWV